MVGGRNYHRSQFNLATQGERQPGSSFKPFVLATALQSGISPATTFVSKPVTIDAGGRLWHVNNYESAYNGTIDLALGDRVLRQLRLRAADERGGPAERRGDGEGARDRTPLNGYFSIGLGGESATPLDMARAYAAFANGGWRIDGAIFGDEPRVVDCLMSKQGDCRRSNAMVGHQVLTDWQAASDRRSAAGRRLYGTGKRAALPRVHGRGQDRYDRELRRRLVRRLHAGLVTAVWVGYPDQLRPMLTEYHGEPVAGGTYPALIWKAFMQKALPYRIEPVGELVPAAAVRVRVARERRVARSQAPPRQRALLQRDDVQLYTSAELGVASCSRLEPAAEEARAREPVAPREIRSARDPDPRAGDDVDRLRAKAQLERRAVEREAVVLARDRERLAQPTRARSREAGRPPPRAARASRRARSGSSARIRTALASPLPRRRS